MSSNRRNEKALDPNCMLSIKFYLHQLFGIFTVQRDLWEIMTKFKLSVY